MSNPALIVVRDKRRRTVALQRFGAPFLVPTLFEGPTCVDALIAEGEPSKLTHDDAIDAAVVVDVNRRVLGVVVPALDALDLPTATKLLAAAWPGFTVEVAPRLSSLSRLVGVDLVKRAITSATKPRYFEPTRNYVRLRLGPDALDRLGSAFLEHVRERETWARPHRNDFGFAGVLTVKKGGALVTRLSDASLGWLLFEGPALLEHVGALPTLEDARVLLAMQRRVRLDDGRWTHLSAVAAPMVHVFIDEEERLVSVTVDEEGAGLEALGQAHLAAQAWPEHRVEVRFGSLEAHFTRAGVPCPPALAGGTRRASPAETVRELERMVRAHEDKLREARVFLGRVPAVMEGIFSELAEEHPGSEIIVRGASSEPRAPASDASAIVRGWERAIASAPDLARAAASLGDAPDPAERVRKAANALTWFEPGRAAAKLALADVEAMRDDVEVSVLRVARSLTLALALEEQTSTKPEGVAVISAALGAVRELTPTGAPEDAWLLAIRSGLQTPWDLDVLQRALDLEANPRFSMWLASQWLARAEAQPVEARAELLGRAQRVSAQSAHRTWFLAWCDACAHSLAEEDVARVRAAYEEALSLHADPEDLAKQMRADPQLCWFFDRASG